MLFRPLLLCVVIPIGALTIRAEQIPGSSAAASLSAYSLDVTASPGPAGVAGLRVAINSPSDGSPVRRLEIVDEKLLHLFIVSRDLRFFRHLYPVPLADGSWEAPEPIPPGEYLIAADFKPWGESRQFLHRVVDLRGELRGDSRGLQNPQLAPTASPDQIYDIVTNVKIQPLKSGLMAGQATAFHVMLSRTEDGRPLVNLEPYLGAGGYLLAVKDDLTEVVRARASVDDLPVSLLTFDMMLSKAGTYAVWVEFQRFGETLTARLAITAR